MIPRKYRKRFLAQRILRSLKRSRWGGMLKKLAECPSDEFEKLVNAFHLYRDGTWLEDRRRKKLTPQDVLIRLISKRIDELTLHEPMAVRVMLRFYLLRDDQKYLNGAKIDVQPQHVRRAHELCAKYRTN